MSLAVALGGVACSSGSGPLEPHAGTGTVTIPLVATGDSGWTYQLRQAEIEFEGPESAVVDVSGNGTVVRAELEPGAYLATLLDGWSMRGRAPGGGGWQAVPARLLSAQPQAVTIVEGSSVKLTLEFAVGDESIAMGKGAVDVVFVVHEGDGGVPEATCGNGLVEPGEWCDDGNLIDGDGCSSMCTIDMGGGVCGDGILDPGEECDDGNLISGDGCSSTCTIDMFGGVCGDGILDQGEECDDGNDVDEDSCLSYCVWNVCGDGVRYEMQTDAANLNPLEECDDANVDEQDSCLSSCVYNQCGDGVTYLWESDPGNPNALEACDDGNDVEGDGCNNDCTLGSCGDGVVDPGEWCDDGNDVEGDGCNNDCQAPYCGNGIVDPGEECDDGNDDSADGCTTWCALACPDEPPVLETNPWCDVGVSTTACDYSDQVCTCEECGRWSCEPKCGNGIVDLGEECDDGNLDPCDGCLPSCEALSPPTPGGDPAVAPATISSDTVWCGDVDVNANLVVLQDATLFVGPGVVRVGDNITLQVRGHIVVGGSDATPVLFTSSSATPAPGDWFGVDVRRDLGATGRVERAIIEYAQRGLSGLDEHGALSDSVFRNNVSGLVDVNAEPDTWCYNSPRPLVIERIEFSDNGTGALPEFDSAYATFDSCSFVGNGTGIGGAAETDVVGCDFSGNDIGIFDFYSSGYLRDSQFVGNDVGISRLYYANTEHNLIADNTTQGIGEVYYEASLLENTIVRNGMGVTFASTPGEFTVVGNTLCDNGSFDLISNTLSSVIAEDNYWCTTDPAVIASRVSDVFDGNPDAGPIFYDPFLTAPSPNAPADPGP